MKETIFRARRLLDNMLITGYYVKHETRQVCPIDDKLEEDEVEHYLIYDTFADWNMPKRMECAKIKPETLQQYTGLRADCGTMIFEGDTLDITRSGLNGEYYTTRVNIRYITDYALLFRIETSESVKLIRK